MLNTLDDVRQRVDRLELPFNRHGFDPYGISKKELFRSMAVVATFYRGYFQTYVHHIERVPPRGRAMLVGNHSGGVALDGVIALASMFLEPATPRLAQGMAEKFLTGLPFASHWLARCGQFTGLPEHAERLLGDERLLLVFPEGTRGTAKLFGERHSLVDFGTGFMRLAVQAKAPIVPFAFVGGGEAVPTVANAYGLGKLLGVPYVPITPWLLPLPLPVRLDIVYGEPMRFEGTGAEEDVVVERWVAEVKSKIAELLREGLHQRAGA